MKMNHVFALVIYILKCSEEHLVILHCAALPPARAGGGKRCSSGGGAWPPVTHTLPLTRVAT